MAGEDCAYPARWEADVVLDDGAVAHLRPARPTDREALLHFYRHVSADSLYLRFFGNHAAMVRAEVDQLTRLDHRDTVGLVVVVRDEIVAVARYVLIERLLPDRVGDVAFLVRDDHQGRGIAPLLLEHLAEVGRENDITRFVAEMLAENRRMLGVFRSVGYSTHPTLSDGNVVVDFAIDPTAQARQIMEQREHRAESAAVRRLVEPRRVGVRGPIARVASSLRDAGFTGEVHLDPDAEGPTGLPADLDLLVLRGDASDLRATITQAAAVARGVLLLASAESPRVSQDDLLQLVATARAHGVRVLGPAALGLINTDPDIRLNASAAPSPRAGSVGLFSQSAGVGTLLLARALETGVGLSTFFSTGAFADVTGNDVMQYWVDDERTRVCLLSLDTVGNPRKFFRVLRRLAGAKPVVVFTPSRALHSARWDEAHEPPSAPDAAIDQAIAQSGAIVVDRRDLMFDVAQILTRQPVPRGRRVAIVSNSAGLADQMAQAALRFGLRPGSPHVATGADAPARIAAAVRSAVDDPAVDAVLAAALEVDEPQLEEVRRCLEQITRTLPDTSILGVFVGFRRIEPDHDTPDGPGHLPMFDSYADALQALSLIVRHDEWRASAAATPRHDPREHPEPPDAAGAHAVVEAILADAPAGREASADEAAAILAAYGLSLVPTEPVSTLAPVIQPTVDAGIPLTLRGIEDRALGPMLCLGVAGAPTDLLDDLAWRVAPLSPEEALGMIASLRSAPLLEGYRGAAPAHWFSIVETLVKLGRLKADLPAVVEAEVSPALAGTRGLSLVGARLRVAPVPWHRDPLVRRAT